MFLELENDVCRSFKAIFCSAFEPCHDSRNLDSGGMPMCDRGARERKRLPEEHIHARTCRSEKD